jgi:phosphoribosyl 1,2-cyclic phosphodiesterase
MSLENTPQIEICLGGVSPFNPYKNGLTTCYGIYIPETLNNVSIGIIIDNGTGIGNVMQFLEEKKPDRTFQLQTHLHHDHVMGFRFNKFLFSQGGITHCMVPINTIKLMALLAQRSLGFHPVDMIAIPDNYEGDLFDDYGVQIESHSLPHGNEAVLGFRITALGKTIIVATDCELDTVTRQVDFAMWTQDATLLILDMEYSDASYVSGWGHNCPKLVTKMLNKRNEMGYRPIQRIIYVHRDSNGQKDSLDINQIWSETSFIRPSSHEIAHDGMVITI